MNPQQLATYHATKKNTKSDEIWTEEVVKVKMMAEYLKCRVLDINKDMNRLFKQNYNFKQYEKDIEWIVETKKPTREGQELTIAERDEEKEARLKALDPRGSLPWGWWFKAKPDVNNNFHVDDLPPETYEPPPSPRGELRAQINNLTADMKVAMRK